MTADMIASYHERWDSVGVETIPLRENQKRPVVGEWQIVPSSEQWAQAESRNGPWAGNMGARQGGGKICIDCDDLPTSTHVAAFFDGLGIHELPIIGTQRGNHSYIRSNPPLDFTWTNLAIGKGELRAARCYAVVPPSTIDDFTYHFEQGAIEDFAHLPIIAWTDLAKLVAPRPKPRQTIDRPPVRLLWRSMPGGATRLLDRLRTAGKGESIGAYRSRSEAVASVVASLILAGWSQEEARVCFDDKLPGHYAEHSNQDAYFQGIWQSVLSTLADTPTRVAVTRMDEEVSCMSWPGRGGLLDLATYRALLATAWQANDTSFDASLRDISMHAACSIKGAFSALHRLEGAGLVERTAIGSWDASSTYRLTMWDQLPSVQDDESCKIRKHNLGTVTRVSLFYNQNDLTGIQELWGRMRLGKSAGIIFDRLSDTPISVADLAQMTGKTRPTVYQALARLRSHGLAEVDADSAGWVRGVASLGDVAKELDCAGAAKNRRDRIKQERDAQRNAMKHLNNH